jgi:flagellar hook protein FlgE
MSLFNAFTTAIGGLTAQGRALGHVADNIANSQTVGYKRIDTAFVSLVTTSSSKLHAPGSVVARPEFANDVQGSVEQVTLPTGLAISGGGMFGVARQASLDTNTGLPIFDNRPLFTRAGDFALDRNGYLVNSAGYFLTGWNVNPNTLVVDRAGVVPIRVTERVGAPVATSETILSANLPANAPIGTNVTSTIGVYDALGNLQTLTVDWTKTANNQWQATITTPQAQTAQFTVDFGQPGYPPGTLSAFSGPGGTNPPTAPPTTAVGDPFIVGLNFNFGSGPQAITLNLGTFGEVDSLTQFAGDDYEVRSIQQNGVPPGSFSSIRITNAGDVVVNYDNGQQRTVYRVPVYTFPDVNELQREDGQAFSPTRESGPGNPQDAGRQGAGGLVVSAIERSNVDVATEFTRLIQAQRAYTSNARVITTTDEMLVDTINLKR